MVLKRKKQSDTTSPARQSHVFFEHLRHRQTSTGLARIIPMKTSFLLSTLVFWTTAASAANYKYSELVVKDYDEMNQMVQERVEKDPRTGQFRG